MSEQEPFQWNDLPYDIQTKILDHCFDSIWMVMDKHQRKDRSLYVNAKEYGSPSLHFGVDAGNEPFALRPPSLLLVNHEMHDETKKAMHRSTTGVFLISKYNYERCIGPLRFYDGGITKVLISGPGGLLSLTALSKMRARFPNVRDIAKMKARSSYSLLPSALSGTFSPRSILKGEADQDLARCYESLFERGGIVPADLESVALRGHDLLSLHTEGWLPRVDEALLQAATHLRIAYCTDKEGCHIGDIGLWKVDYLAGKHFSGREVMLEV